MWMSHADMIALDDPNKLTPPPFFVSTPLISWVAFKQCQLLSVVAKLAAGFQSTVS